MRTDPKQMKKTSLGLAVVIAAAVIAIVLLPALGVAAQAFSKPALGAQVTPTWTPSPLPDAVIPLKPIPDLTSLNATAKLDVNGLVDGKRTQGDLNAVLASNDQGESRITMTGSLLGEVAAQMGGSLLGLFAPSSVDIYKVPQDTYVVVNSLFPVCVRLEANEATAMLDEMSPQSLLSMLTSSDVLRGKLVGQETLHGIRVKHYVIDGDAFLAAAQKSSDPDLKAFGKALRWAEDADLYVDAKGGYPVAFRGGFSGSYEPLKLEGDLDVQIELTGVNTGTLVNLPNSCRYPISP